MLNRLLKGFWSAALIIGAVILSSTGAPALAQPGQGPRMWPYPTRNDWNGIPVRQGHHIEWQRAGYRRASDGYTLTAWSDCRTGDRDVYAQLISPDGRSLWDVNGKPVINYPYRQEDPEVVSVSGGWVVAWIDYRFDSSGDVFAQKFSDAGTKLWDPDGALVDTFNCSTPNCGHGVAQTTLRAVDDGSGGAIIAWEDTRRDNGGDIFAQRIMSNGTRAWNGPLHVTYEDGGQSGITADGDGSGDMLVAWQDGRNQSNQDIYVAKVTPAGQLPWGGENGMVVCDTTGAQSAPKLCPDGLGGCYIAWTDQRNTTDDLYMQRFNGSGIAQWVHNGVPLCTAPYNQGEVRVATSYNGTTADGCLTTWEDKRVNGQRQEVFVQKINAQGVAQWTPDGLRVCGNAGHDTLGPTGQDRAGVRLTTDYAGGLVCAWEDSRNSDNDLQNCDLYGIRVLADGTLSWGGECGHLLAGGDRAQNQPVLRMGDASHIIAVYDDYSQGSQAVRYQRYNLADATPTLPIDSILATGLDGDASLPMTVAMTPGRAGIVWQDNRAVTGGTALFYQVVDSSGHFERALNGDSLVPDNSGSSVISQHKPQVCPDDAGGFFVTFEDIRTGASRIRLSHVNSVGTLASSRAGNLIWADAQTTDQVDAFCTPDGTGGCYVAWSNYNLAFHIDAYVMRMTADCQPAWPQAVRLTQTDDDDMMFGVVSNPDPADGCIMVWKSGSFGDFNISTAKVHPDGSIVYHFNVCDAADEQDNPTVIADGAGGAYFAWDDKRNAEPRPGYDKDIYAQHLDATGAETWGGHNGIVVVSDTLAQQHPKLAQSGDGQIFCVWETFGVADSSLNLSAQKFTPTGTRQWPVLGKPMCVAVGDQTDAVLYPEWGNGLFVVWSDSRVYFPDIYGTHWWADGTPAGSPGYGWWNTPAGGVITDYYQWQVKPSVASDGGGGIFCVWQDQRASGKDPVINIWMNRINDHYTGITKLPQAAIPTKMELFQNYPNPFNPSTRITFSVPATQRVTMEVFNTLGQRVTTLVDRVMTAGKYEVIFDSPRLASGMYYYRLKSSNFVDVKKMLFLK